MIVEIDDMDEETGHYIGREITKVVPNIVYGRVLTIIDLRSNIESLSPGHRSLAELMSGANEAGDIETFAVITG